MKESSLRDLRIADLELFITAARLKNLGKAAEIHYLSQSAASSAILRVERAFGEKLCHHERRQFSLTREGDILIPKAIEWLAYLKERVATHQPRPIRLVTTHAIARACMPLALGSQNVQLKLMRPDSAYEAVLRDEADLALVLDNAPWGGLMATEIGGGSFQLYSKLDDCRVKPILLPEDQIEVLTLQQRWQKTYGQSLEIKARVPSWSLIADICMGSEEVGFLPDFLGEICHLKPVPWQPEPSSYRVLALYQKGSHTMQLRLHDLFEKWKEVFSSKARGAPL